MRIAFISIIKEAWGGSEELWAAAAFELLKEGHEIWVSAHDTGMLAPRMQQLKEAGARILFRRGYIKPGIPVRERVARKILHFGLNRINNPYSGLFKQDADVYVYTGACDSLKHDPYFLSLLYPSGKPLILINQVHTEYIKTFDDREAGILSRAFHYARKNLFVSNRNKEVMERFLADNIPNAEVIRNPVNLSSLGIIPYPVVQPVQLAMVANLLINHKGQDILFEILSKDEWQQRSWHLNLYGGGMDEIYLKKLCAYFGLESRVTFHGKVADIRKVWEANHILLMPSRLEGMPLAMVEAMLCGRTVVATDVAGHTEWIRENVDGYIAEAANVLSFHRAMERAWNDQHRWEAMGRSAFERALGLYDPAPGKTLSGIIKEVLIKP